VAAAHWAAGQVVRFFMPASMRGSPAYAEVWRETMGLLASLGINAPLPTSTALLVQFTRIRRSLRQAHSSRPATDDQIE
jgi:hypothetical protein